MADLELAERLLAAGIPVIVVGPGDVPRQAGWQRLSATECDLSNYRPGHDALAVVGGHGIDLVDVDTKAGKRGSVDHLPPFKSYGTTRTPSGGLHYVVPSSGVGKVSPLTTTLGHVGDYVGGRADGTGRMFAFLPGSVRTKYPDGGYVEEVPWDVEACLAAEPDPDLIAALLQAGGAREARSEAYLDDSPPRDAALGLHPYADKAIRTELARLDECDVLGWDGPYWDQTTFDVACNLVEFANSGWSGYDLDRAEADLLNHAPTDEGFGPAHHAAKWASALNRVGGGGRRPPQATAQEDFAEPLSDERSTTDATFQPMNLRKLLDPHRPPREYVLDPMLAVGTSVAFVAPAGHRKSLLALGIALAVARGDAAFANMPIPRARRVLYLDMENTEDDLAERLTSFGVTCDEDLSRFLLVSLPSMDPLDTAKGGRAFVAAVDGFGLEPGDVVVLDSYQRVTEAGENDSDTTRGYYRHTGVHLKARGLTVIRTDNTGKDVSRGARGSSGKRDDVDVEYLLESQAEYIDVKVGKTRQRGVSQLSFYVSTDADGRTSFRSDLPSPTKAKVQECVELLDRLQAPDSTGERKAKDLIAQSGEAVPTRPILRSAIKERQGRANQAAHDFSETGER